jgi:hypothetical protein
VSETDRIAQAYAGLESRAGWRWNLGNPGNQAILAERRDRIRRLLGAAGMLAGPDCEQLPLLGCVARDIAGVLRPRTDEAHLTFDDIEQLRQLVDLRPSQEPSHACDARVVAGGHGRTGRRRHRAQLVNPELAPAAPNAGAAVESGAWRFELDRDRRRHDERRCNHKSDQRNRKVKRPLQLSGRAPAD